MKRLPPASLGRWPFASATAAGIGALLCAQWHAWGVLVAMVVVLLAGGLYLRRPTLVFAGIVALIFSCLHNDRLKARDALVAQLATPSEVFLKGTLTESNSSGLVQRAFSTDAGARVNLIGLPEQYLTGQRLRLVVEARPEQEQRNPSGFDFEKILRERGFAGSVQVLAVEKVGPGTSFAILRGWSESLRQALGERITRGITQLEDRQLIRAVVLGEKPTNGNILEDFRQTGTMHVFAVSGLHVGLIALIVALVARLLRLPPRLTIYLVIITMFGYALVTGLRPPALRAALMGAIYLSRYLLNRRVTVANNLLAAALVVLAFDTFQLWQIGFQLSFFVVAIILLLEPHFWQRVEFLSEQDPFLPKPLWTLRQRFSTSVRANVLRSFTVSSSAWLGSAPLSFIYFGWITPIATLASVVMIYAAFLILATAFVSIILGSFFPAGAALLNQGNSLIAGGARSSARVMSDWPGAWVQVDGPRPWRDGLCVFDIPFGGGAIHLDVAGGVLIDGASSFDYWRTVEPALEESGVTCDSLIASHADAQHVGGFKSALQHRPIQQLLVPINETAGTLRELRAIAIENQVPVIDATDGMTLPIAGDTTIEILSGGDETMGRADDRGLVLMIHHHNWRILYTADTGYATEKRLLASGRNLAADVWICGRNASDMTGHDAFVKAVSPRVLVASDRRYPVGESVPPSWREWLESRGTLVMSQREHGAVFILPSSGKLVIEGYLTKKRTLIKR